MKNISVIGAGTMGNGIAHVFSQFGYAVTLNDVRDDLIEKGLTDDRRQHRPPDQEGRADGGRQGQDPAGHRPFHGSTLGRLEGRPGDRGGDGKPGDQDGDLPRHRGGRAPRRHPGFEHVIHLHHGDRGRDRAGQPGDRHAFHEPGPRDETRGGDPGTVHRRCDDRGRPGGGAEPREDTRRGERLPGIHLQQGAPAR